MFLIVMVKHNFHERFVSRGITVSFLRVIQLNVNSTRGGKGGGGMFAVTKVRNIGGKITVNKTFRGKTFKPFQYSAIIYLIRLNQMSRMLEQVFLTLLKGCETA